MESGELLFVDDLHLLTGRPELLGTGQMENCGEMERQMM